MNNYKKLAKIYYDDNIDNINDFLSFQKWISDNSKIVNLWFSEPYNPLVNLVEKYTIIYTQDKITHNIFNQMRYNNIVLRNLKDDNLEILINQTKNILYYKLLNNSSLYFWELNQTYKIIKNDYKTLYEINVNDTISDSIILINDKYFPLKKLLINYLNVNFLSPKKKLKNIFDDMIKNYKKNYQNLLINNAIDFDSYEKYLDRIPNIDFIYLSLFPKTTMISSIPKFNITHMFELFTFLKIINKVNINGSMCIFLCQVRNYNQLKLISLYSYFFETFYLTYPEIYGHKGFNCTYLILQNKKNIKFDPTELLNDLMKNSSSLSINYKLFTNENELEHETKKTLISNKEYFDSYDGKIISKIDFINPDIEKIYIKLQQEHTNLFNIVSSGLLKNVILFNDLHSQKENGTLTEEKILEIKQYNLEECKKWARKYDMPLVPEHNIVHSDLSYENIMYRDIISFEKDIYFKFKFYDITEPDIQFTTLDKFLDLPKSFEKMIIKSREDKRAFDYRDIDTYRSIKHKIDYYYKKLTYAISLIYPLPNEHINNDEWLKITEILFKIKLIDETKTNLKSFHICEFTGSYVNAITFFLYLKMNKVPWTWKAQRLNPKFKMNYNDTSITNDFDLVDFDNSISFDENMLNNYYDNYDFGKDNTGDITTYENIQYYRKNHNDYELVTAGCGIQQNDTGYILSYSQYLMIFSCCKKRGNAILKRVFPIENTQEISMLYLFYCLFENVIIYKPKINYHSQEFYLIGLNYKGINQNLLDKLIDFLQNYKLVGFITSMPNTFTLQVDKAQNELIENMNKFIKKQIYFCDNYENIKEEDWGLLKKAIREKLKDWFNDIGA